MQEPRQVTLIARFRRRQEAEAVRQQLQSAKCGEVAVDRLSEDPSTLREERINPSTGNEFAGLADLTMDTAGSDRSASILLANDPDASGVADTDREPLGTAVLTALVPAEQLEEARQIIKAGGGQF
ncbi:MAG: hypothetical protein IMW91_08920 [Firmicutes bacterium]|nr:hypothetical protein [Bacillota bacterium]